MSGDSVIFSIFLLHWTENVDNELIYSRRRRKSYLTVLNDLLT